jgi:hypothetical protein
MKLVTYMDEGTLRTLMVDWFLDRYNTAGGWMVKVRRGGSQDRDTRGGDNFRDTA